MEHDFESFAALVRSRRTSLLMDRERPVSATTVDELCALAAWAPNHKKTWPWKFAEFTGAGRARLGETMAADMVDADFGDSTKREKTRTKYLRAPSVLVVGCEPHPNEMLHQENRDAVAAAIQNTLLGATALGLASFWSTPALSSPPKVLELCGFDQQDRVIGMLYLGWPVGECAVPERPVLSITRVSS
ncbi:nitroreductase [Ilumatobacter sp.]|uniref:nitroreductase family protein n=1 Tax=Ilumatobacter sp. TaxID=1967498 RepID=UPI003751F88B